MEAAIDWCPNHGARRFNRGRFDTACCVSLTGGLVRPIRSGNDDACCSKKAPLPCHPGTGVALSSPVPPDESRGTSPQPRPRCRPSSGRSFKTSGQGLIMATKAKIGVLGASGYTGGELIRVLLRHPRAEIVLLTAERSAGKTMRDVFPQFSPFALPQLVAIDGLDWAKATLDIAFCALPHATTQKVIKNLLARSPTTKVVDLSADFRLADTSAYAKWYGHEHYAPELQKETVYGLTEILRGELKKARLIAKSGCYTTCQQ